MNVDVADLLAVLRPEPLGDGRYRATSLDVGGPTAFGGQLMAQALLVGSSVAGHSAKTLHTIFVRPIRVDEPFDVDVEELQSGRSFSSCTISMRQADRICVRSQLLRSAAEPDFVHHAEPAPAESAPAEPAPLETVAGRNRRAGASGSWEVVVAGDVDVDDPDLVGPAALDVWSRFPGAPDDPVLDQALLAFATDGFLIATAMRPHAGVGQSQAHRSVETGVIGHTLTFHRPARASQWLLLSHRSPFAGGGRCYGRADVFDRSGDLVASFVQDGLLRAGTAAVADRGDR